MRGTLLGALLSMAACGADAAPTMSMRRAVQTPAPVTEPRGLRIGGVTIGPEGRPTPFGVSGGDPLSPLVGPTVDPTYAYTPENPARVGGAGGEGEPSEEGFLNALWGPQGQPIYYQRIGSCCPLPDFGMLDAFALTYDGLGDEPLIVYLDVYHRDQLFVPVGLRGTRATGR